MIVDVKLFASLREYLPADAQDFTAKAPAAAGAKVKTLLDWLKLPVELPKVILINGRHANETDEVQEGDVVSVFPPISGGSRRLSA